MKYFIKKNLYSMARHRKKSRSKGGTRGKGRKKHGFRKKRSSGGHTSHIATPGNMYSTGYAGISAYEGAGLTVPYDPNQFNACWKVTIGRLKLQPIMVAFAGSLSTWDEARKAEKTAAYKQNEDKFFLRSTIATDANTVPQYKEIFTIAGAELDNTFRTNVSAANGVLSSEASHWGVDRGMLASVFIASVRNGNPSLSPEALKKGQRLLHGTGAIPKDLPTYDIYKKPGGSRKHKRRRHR